MRGGDCWCKGEGFFGSGEIVDSAMAQWLVLNGWVSKRTELVDERT